MEPLDIFLLMGQSNMAGRGLLDPGASIRHPRILAFKQGHWEEASEPLFDDRPGAGIGPGMSFALALVEADPTLRIGLVPSAVGGTPLSRWEPQGDLYQRNLKWAQQARQQGTLRGMLWHQGESDAQEESLAKTYGERLAAMIRSLRRDLEEPALPVLLGELGEFLDGDERFPGYREVNAALAQVAAELPACVRVSAAGLRDLGDRVHFDALSQREFGRRYAAAYRRLIS